MTLNCIVLIGTNSKETFTSANHLSTLWRVAGKAGKAEKLLGETLARCRSTLGNMYAPCSTSLLCLFVYLSLTLPCLCSLICYFSSSFSPLLSLFCFQLFFIPHYLLIIFFFILPFLIFLSYLLTSPLLSFLHHYG